MTRPEIRPLPLPSGVDAGAWLAFAGCLIALFMQMIDVTIVNTALPNITADLAASHAQQLLMVSGFSLAFACTLLPAARIGELLGRRTMFLASVAAFTAASVWCGLSTGAAELVAARMVQGATGAGMAAQTIAILTAIFPRERHRDVFAVYGAVAGFAGMLGPLTGGALITADPFGFGWHSIFLINLPMGALAFGLGWRYLHLGKQPCPDRLAVPGVVLAAASLFALLYALADIHQNGPRTGSSALIGISLVLGTAFLAAERRATRLGKGPLVRPDLFQDRGFAIGSVLVAVFFGLFTAFVFAISITVQDLLLFSPLRTGLVMTPFALGAGAGAVASPMIVRRWGVRPLAVGMACYGGCVAVGAIYLHLSAGVISLALVVGPVFLSGLGVGLFAVQLPPILLAGLDQRRMDAASGVLPTIEQIGSSVGLAVLSAMFFRAHTLTGSITMFLAIAAIAIALAAATLLLPEPTQLRGAGR